MSTLLIVRLFETKSSSLPHFYLILTLMCEVSETNPVVEIHGQDIVHPGLLLCCEKLSQVSPIVPTELETLSFLVLLTMVVVVFTVKKLYWQTKLRISIRMS